MPTTRWRKARVFCVALAGIALAAHASGCGGNAGTDASGPYLYPVTRNAPAELFGRWRAANASQVAFLESADGSDGRDVELTRDGYLLFYGLGAGYGYDDQGGASSVGSFQVGRLARLPGGEIRPVIASFRNCGFCPSVPFKPLVVLRADATQLTLVREDDLTGVPYEYERVATDPRAAGSGKTKCGGCAE